MANMEQMQAFMEQMQAQQRQLTEAVSRLEAQNQALNQQQAEGQAQLQGAHARSEELQRQLLQKEEEMAQAFAEAEERGAGAGRDGGWGEKSALVSKWAPDNFSGENEAWKDWSVKFVSYLGGSLKGQVGKWVQHVDENRGAQATITVLGEASRAASSMLHGALIATCQGKALVLVQRAGQGEGLEAWRSLLLKYEPRSKQSKVVKLCEVLGYNFNSDNLLDSLEAFEAKIVEYEKEAEKTVDDDIKIGVVIRGIAKGSLREHMLLHSERTETYEAFRAEIDTIARAQAATLLGATPMDVSAFGKGGVKPTKFDGNCSNCGKKGHKVKDCFLPGGGAHKPGGKGGGKGNKKGGQAPGSGGGKSGQPGNNAKKCFRCGMTNHVKADCRASDAKVAKHQASQKNVRSLEETGDGDLNATSQDGGSIGGFDLCQLCGAQATEIPMDLCEVANDAEDGDKRTITFAVDTAACRTVVPLGHEACRGYRVHSDEYTGQTYGTASKKGPRIKDEGKRILQTKGDGQNLPQRLNTRKADVNKPLLAVCDMVDHGHAVLFDSTGSYAIKKATGQKTNFQRVGKGWNLTLDLEAPAKANRVMSQMLAELRECKAANEGPTVELNVLGSEVQLTNGGSSLNDYKNAPVLREDPLFRLASR